MIDQIAELTLAAGFLLMFSSWPMELTSAFVWNTGKWMFLFGFGEAIAAAIWHS